MAEVPVITSVTRNKKFDRDVKALDRATQLAVKAAVDDLFKNPIPAMRRLHSLQGYKNPKIYTIDVYPNKSYKISLEIEGCIANLRRVATHKEIDDQP